jgi:cytochrome c oxidase accessory protein FixG
MEQTVLSTKPKRQWIFAKKPAGTYYNKRQWVGYSLIFGLIAAPFIHIQGQPMLLLDVLHRKFVFLGHIFFPQDLHLFVFAMLILMVFVVLFTVKYGRLWCGWVCPQTIFMELVFRRIEYWLEGDAAQQRKNQGKPLTSALRLRKVVKHILFLLVSFFISNLFLAYFIGVKSLWEIMTDPINQHLGGLISMILFTLIFYGVFAFVREIVCTTICPYGRLQGVLLDHQSVTVAYHYGRGEPRGPRKQEALSSTGDCVDCSLCVHVCPTGIDIRKGIQMECVNCTACIDACDAVMDKLQRPKGLIGFYSMAELEGQVTQKKQTKVWAYACVLVILCAGLIAMLMGRSEVEGTLLRAKGSTYQIREDGTVTNLYNLELVNKTRSDLEFTLQANLPEMTIQQILPISQVPQGKTVSMTFFLIYPQHLVQHYKSNIELQVIHKGKNIENLKTTFIAPPLAKAGE